MHRTLPFHHDAYIVTGRLDPVSDRITMLVTGCKATAVRFCNTLTSAYRTVSFELFAPKGEGIPIVSRRVSGEQRMPSDFLCLTEAQTNDALCAFLSYQIEWLDDELIDDTWWSPDLPDCVVRLAARGSGYDADARRVDPMSMRDRRLKKAGIPWSPMESDRPLHDSTDTAARRRTNCL